MSVLHAWSRYPMSGETARRAAVAQRSWTAQLWRERPVDDAELPRLFSEGARKLPYVQDLLDIACVGLEPQDIVVFTNADIIVASNAALRIVAACQVNDAGYAFRRDAYHKLLEPPPDDDFAGFVDYAGADLFFFRAGWWRQYRKHYPDMVFAREAWDCLMRYLIEETNPHKPLALPDLCVHERHENGWENPRIRYSLTGQRNNLVLATAFLRQRGVNPHNHGIRLP